MEHIFANQVNPSYANGSLKKKKETFLRFTKGPIFAYFNSLQFIFMDIRSVTIKFVSA